RRDEPRLGADSLGPRARGKGRDRNPRACAGVACADQQFARAECGEGGGRPPVKSDMGAGRLARPPAPAVSTNSTTGPLIELVGLTKTYRSGELDVEVLHGVSLKIYPGEFLAIMGASGVGKTTLNKMIGCLARPARGPPPFMGRGVSGFRPGEPPAAAARGVRF